MKGRGQDLCEELLRIQTLCQLNEYIQCSTVLASNVSLLPPPSSRWGSVEVWARDYTVTPLLKDTPDIHVWTPLY